MFGVYSLTGSVSSSPDCNYSAINYSLVHDAMSKRVQVAGMSHAARPSQVYGGCGTAHAQMLCHPETKSKVRPKRPVPVMAVPVFEGEKMALLGF